MNTPPETFPLTEAQEGLWYAQALDVGNPILNTGQYLELNGPLDRDALLAAVSRTTAESAALRLRFKDLGAAPVQWLDPAPIVPSVIDLSAEEDPQSKALALMHADSDRPLNLAEEPVAAFTLFILGAQRHLLYERIHHLATDGYGFVLITNRIGEHYDALTGDGPEPVPFAPFDVAIEDEVAWRGSDRRQVARDWWHSRLADLPEVSGPAPGRAVSAHGFLRESQWLPPELLVRLQEFSTRHKLGWPDVLTGLSSAYLARWTGGQVVVGLPFMARLGRPLARTPCMAMNVLPQLVTPDEDRTTAEWLADLVRDMRQARRYGQYRSEFLRRELGLIGGSRRLYGPLVNVQPFDRPPKFAGLDVALHILGAGAVDDLTLTFRGDPDAGVLFEVDANPDLYAPHDVRGHSDRLVAFLDAALSAPTLATVPTASAAEISALDRVTDAARHAVPETTLASMIDAQMQTSPDAPALSFDDRTLSYAELDARSAALAQQLRRLGAGADRIVAVALKRSLELPIALLAVLRAGAAYLPLDPDHPPDRIAGIIAQAQPVAVLTSADIAGSLPAQGHILLTDDWSQEADDTLPAVAPGDLAYVIFTSGSTGAPKGVAIEHRAIVNRLAWMAAQYGFGPDDRILQKTPASFDVSVWEFFLPLVTGGHLVMAPPDAHRDPTELAALIRRHRITTLHFVPSMLSAFLASPASAGLALSRVFCSGEELTADLRDRFHTRIRAELHNLYGPTEAAVDVSFWPAGPEDRSNPVPIGWPVWNTRLAVLDDRMRPVPPGLAGNLYLGGCQLARGYLGRDDLTRERFVDDPQQPGVRLYATGDLARLRHDGAAVFLGRSDHQVKIRGLRIELGEIEAAIMATGLAQEAVVIAREDHAGDKRLVTYLVPSDRYQAGQLTAHLSASLPGYMLPSAEVVLDAMPMTTNGKLDRKELPAPQFETAGRTAETAAERLLAGLYAEILHLQAPVSVLTDFFDAGGDSLSAVRLSLRIAEETGHDIGLGAIFENPVLEGMAAALSQGAVSDGLGALLLLADGDPNAPPLFLIHPAGGLSWGYRHLARLVAPGRHVWGIQHPGLDLTRPLPDSLDALARDYVGLVRDKAGPGPVHLAGWSVGGIIAQAMAAELEERAISVGMVAALDSYPADAWRDEPEPDPIAALRALLAIAGFDPEAHRDLDSREKVTAFLQQSDTALGALPGAVLDGVIRVVTDTNRLVRGHRHRRQNARLIHIAAALDHEGTSLHAGMWDAYAGDVAQYSVPFMHAQMTAVSASEKIAEILNACMQEYDGIT
ncbi:MAG: amino acid adenylation domain-containing protein [Paracoccus denitrificans]|uniref:Amino acid adenylation domain-containing protein n=1 Tax=Paracoccus denitrificans TaxID=266 RepID=A0A533IFB3_PARDE|nr:MAG: amino acid adenylation domain-containing protein [Paracoccus denitrificans]